MSMPTHRWGAPYRCLAWVLIPSLLAASCATRNVPPIGAGGKPFKPESDEVRLWSQADFVGLGLEGDRKSTRLNSSHLVISYAVFCLKKKKNKKGEHGEAADSGLELPAVSVPENVTRYLNLQSSTRHRDIQCRAPRTTLDSRGRGCSN